MLIHVISIVNSPTENLSDWASKVHNALSLTQQSISSESITTTLSRLPYLQFTGFRVSVFPRTSAEPCFTAQYEDKNTGSRSHHGSFHQGSFTHQ